MEWSEYFLGDDDTRTAAGLSIFDDIDDEEEEDSEDTGKWQEFLDTFYEGGKKLVPNTHLETKDAYPKVQVSTLLKNDSVFHSKLIKEYESWVAQGAAPTSFSQSPVETPTDVLQPSQVEVGDFLESDVEDEPWHGKVISIETDHIMVQDVDPKTGKTTGKPWALPNHEFQKFPTRKWAPPAPKPKKKNSPPSLEHSHLQTNSVLFDSLSSGDVVLTKAFGPQKIVGLQGKTKVRLESGIVVSKGALEKAGKPFTAEYVKTVDGYEPPDSGAPKHVTMGAPSWKADSAIARRAEAYYPQYKEVFADKFAEAAKEMRELAKSPSTNYWQGKPSMWDDMSEGERMLAMAGHKVAKYFKALLTPDEWLAWSKALGQGGWQSNSGSDGAHRMMGALEELGVEGTAKAHEQGGHISIARDNGRHNLSLKRAISKAMAFSRAFYDSIGVTHIALYRGTKNKDAYGASPGTSIKTNTAREMASFTINPAVGYNFNSRSIRYMVPVSRLFISPVTFGQLHSAIKPYTENEFVVIGQNGLIGKVMPKVMSEYDPELMALPKVATEPLVIDFSEEDDNWLRHPEEEKAASIVRLASQHDDFRKALLQELRALHVGS